MPTTIYDSSLITQRRKDKTVSGSFINRIQNPVNPNTGSAPYLGITQQSIINTVKNGQMTDYRKNDGGCTNVSPGCPCDIQSITTGLNLQLPSVITNIQYSYGSIITSWNIPTFGTSPFTYNVNLIPASQGLSFTVYDGYFADNVNFFNAAQPITAPNSGTSANFSDINNSVAGLSLPGNNFSVQWFGYFLAAESGEYTFKTSSDDASYVWIGPNAITGFTTSNALVNNGGLHGEIEKIGKINLSAGTMYPIRVQYGENDGGQQFKLSFSFPSFPNTFIFGNSPSELYYFSQPALNYTTSSTTFTFDNSVLVSNAQYYLTVNAFNAAGTGPNSFYTQGGPNPFPIRALYPAPTMTGSNPTANTYSINYNFPDTTNFVVIAVESQPTLPVGWSISGISNSGFLLTKALPNPASLPNTQKFILKGANPTIQTTYPSNAVSGIATLGYAPSISQTDGTATTAVLTISTPYLGFNITNASVDPATPLPSNWSFTSFTAPNLITLTWNGTGTSLISSNIRFIVTNGTVNSPPSNNVSGINTQIGP
jgi:hypothetical protein